MYFSEYLAKFSHLIAYHDPELTNHLDNIGFIPEVSYLFFYLSLFLYHVECVLTVLKSE